MSLLEAILLLVIQMNWKNILLLNACDEGSARIAELLSDAGIPFTVVDYNDMNNYPWPERLNFKPRLDGFVMIVGPQVNFTEILLFLKEKHMITTRRFWIVGMTMPLCLQDIVETFHEGDRVLILGNNVSDSKTGCSGWKKEAMKSQEYEIQNNISMWTLRSPGNGSWHFERSFLNLSNFSEPFDVPFTNFKGRTLKISSLGSPPIKIPPKAGSERWGGYIFRIINTLADIFNFTYVVKEADDRFYGLGQEDGTWTGMIGELTRKSMDVGTGDLSWTLERSLVVDLTKTIFPETVTFIYRAPDFYSRTWILFEVIEPKIWISITSATIAAFVAYFLALSLHKMRKKRVNDAATMCVETADESISSLYRALLGKGVMNVPFPISCRTVLGTWFIGSLILNALYGGSLTSKLSLHKSPKPADSLKELLKRHPNSVLALRNNSQIHGFFKKSMFWHKVWLKNMEKYIIPGKLRIEDTMVKVHSSHDDSAPYVWVAERSMLVKMMHRYSDDNVVCDLYVGKEDIVRSDWTLALQRDSPFLLQFNEMIDRMQRFGLLEKWRREFWEAATGSCHPNDGLNESGETPITMEDTRAIFFVLAIGWAVGITILVVERKMYDKTRI